MKEKEAIKILRSMQNPKEDYADIVCAPAFCTGFKSVYPEPEDYAIEEAINALKEIQKYREIDRDILRFLLGEWCEGEKVQKALGMTFEQCLGTFDISRSAEWWSVVGKTEEERKRNGQKIIVYFRIKKEDAE